MADAAYEWGQGQYASDGTRAKDTWTRALSQDLAAAYGAWVNEMDLRDGDDNQLTLDETETGAFSMGSYASAILDAIDEAATYFVQNTSFPYAYTPQRLEDPTFPGDPNLVATRAADVAAQGQASSAPADGTGEDEVGKGSDANEVSEGTGSAPLAGVAQVQSTVYDSAQSYFASLNADNWWINYSHSSSTVSITSLREFVLHLRPAALAASPFDLPDRSSKSNQLFGIGEESTLHFDAMVADLVGRNAEKYAELDGWDDEYETAWEDDLEKVDALETGMLERVSMMNPLYWLSGHYDGYGQSAVAPHWRVNEGLFDTDTSLCTAPNLVFALRKYDGVSDVSHTPVWGQGHVLAERTGSATANLLSWVADCCDE